MAYTGFKIGKIGQPGQNRLLEGPGEILRVLIFYQQNLMEPTMGIEQLGPSTQTAIVVIKPQEPGPMRVPTDSQYRRDGAPASADMQTIQKAVQEITQPGASTLEFNTDAETGKVIVKIMDSTTGELIRQIPMEEMLVLARSLDRLQGLLLRTTA